MFIYIWAFGVNVPYMDEWNEHYRVSLFLQGKHTLIGLFDQHNEHRPATQRVALILLGALTSYNTKVEMMFTQWAMVLALLVLYVEFKKIFDSKAYLILFIPVPYIIFSLRQNENILWAHQSCVYYSVIFGLLTCHFMSKINSAGAKYNALLQYCFGAVSAAAASFSLLSGLLAWPAGFFQILISDCKKGIKAVMLFLWSVMGTIVVLLYFHDYHKPPHHPGLDSFFKYPAEGIIYFIYLVGNTLFTGSFASFITGVFIVAATGLLLIFANRGFLRKYSFWIASLCYFSATLVLIAIGRASLTFHYVIPVRYITFGIAIPICLYVIYLGITSENISNKLYNLSITIFIALSAFMLSSIVNSFDEGYGAGKTTKMQRERVAYYLYTYMSQPDKSLELMHLVPAQVREWAADLQKRKFSVFKQPYLPPISELKALPIETYCSGILNSQLMNNITSQVVIEDKHNIMRVEGWAVDNMEKDIAGGVYIKIDDMLFPALYGLYRPDVGNHLKSHAYVNSGYEAEIPVSLIDKGIHNLSIVVLTKDRKHYYKPTYNVAINRV
ncbi:MAG: hypothetical protein HQL01_00455 [Nitrospirae bacterium]|nr:hypothetical protein [Nitrospirota bacterium]